MCNPEIERKTKAIIKQFKEFGLNVTIQTNFKILNFQEVEMNLDTGTYESHRKPDNRPVYLNKIVKSSPNHN